MQAVQGPVVSVLEPHGRSWVLASTVMVLVSLLAVKPLLLPSRMLEALPPTLLQLLVELLPQSSMLPQGRTFVLFWVLAQLMLPLLVLVVRVQLRLSTLVLHGRGLGGANGRMQVTIKSWTSTALH